MVNEIVEPAPSVDSAPVADSTPVNMFNPQGELKSIPAEQVQEALKNNYLLPKPGEEDAYFKKIDSAPQDQAAIPVPQIPVPQIEERVNVLTPSGETKSIPKAQLQDAISIFK